MPSETPNWVKGRVLAEAWGLAPKTLDNWRSRGVGPPFVKINGAVRYDIRACERWLEDQQQDVPRGAA